MQAKYWLWAWMLCWSWSGFGQTDSSHLRFFEPARQPHKTRLWALSGGIVAAYSATTVGLNQAWYAQYPRTGFHFFNDWDGWRQMDKAGHAFTAYFESKWVGGMYRWAGLERRRAAWVGAGAGMLFQTTLEMLDGFSGGWGFSWGDMGFNTLGSGLYLGQELAWGEQRLRIKMSLHQPRYSNAPLQAINSQEVTSMRARAESLFGTSLAEQFIKEYNGQTIWLSANVSAFLPKKPRWLPTWANVAVGYSIENVLGAQRNTWTNANGSVFVAPANYPRYSQFFFSLDIDFERIRTKKRWVRTLLGIANIIKIPFPALEINTLGQVRGRWLYF